MDVRIYGFVGPGYFGFGLSPDTAVDLAIQAGMDPKKVKHGHMYRLPEGIIKYDVNGFGGLEWWFPDNVDASTKEKAKRMYFNPSNSDWQDSEPVVDPDELVLPKFRIRVVRKLVGVVEIAAEDKDHALEEVEFMDPTQLSRLIDEEDVDTKVEIVNDRR